MNTDQAFQYLRAAIEKEPQHKWYKHVITGADFNKRMLTGVRQKEDMIRFVRTESEEMMKQRLDITQTITPAMTGSAKQIFMKVFRVEPEVSQIDFDTADKKGFTEKIKEVTDAMNVFFGGRSVDRYLATRVSDLMFLDPNAFVVVEFDSFDNTKEKAKPRPVEYTSDKCIDYGYHRDRTLNYLLIKEEVVMVKVNPNGEAETRKGIKYTLYFKDWVYVLTELYDNSVPFFGEKIANKSGTRWFDLRTHNSKAGRVQAVRIGYFLDLETDGETFVSPLHMGKSYLLKTIKLVSEMDLTTCLYVHPRIMAFVEQCKVNHSNGKCATSGQLPSSCTMCNKSGMRIPTTTQDARYFVLPKNMENLPDIRKLEVEVHPDPVFLQLMVSMIEGDKSNFHKSIFNSKTYVKDTIENTATAVREDADMVFDPLSDYARQMAYLWEELTIITANFIDQGEGLIVKRAWGDDFNLKTLTERLLDLQMANSSNAPGEVRQILTEKIMTQVYAKDQIELKRYKSKQKLFPLSGKTENEIMLAMSGNDISQFNKVLWANFDSICDELEIEHDHPDWFYDFAYSKQKQLVKEKVDAILKEKENEKPVLELPAQQGDGTE